VITAIGCLIVLFPLLYIKDILLGIGQDPEIVDIAVVYIYWCMPGVFLNAFSMQNVLYCGLLESTRIFVYEGIVSNVTHITMLIIFVGWLGMGFTGLAIASSAQFTSRWVCSVLFMKFNENHKITDHSNVPFFSKVSVQDLPF
jgi:Na+-driven multidrug efflux pump